MKRTLLSTIQTFVFVFVVSVFAFAAKAEGPSSFAPPDPCSTTSLSISSSYSKFSGYCTSSSDKECVSNVLDCIQNNSSGEDDDSDNTEECYAFSYQNYKSDLKDMQSEQKDSKKTLADLQKDKISAQKDFNEQKAKLTQDQHDAADDYNKQKLQDKEDQRKAQGDQKAQQDDLNKQQRDLQMAILQKQNQQALLTSQRATQIDDYKMKLLQCKSDTQKYQAQVQNHTLGGLAGLAVKGGGAANDVNTYWQACVNKVLKQRDDDANKYSVATTQLNAEITQAQQQLVDVQKSLQLAQTQAQQQMQDDATKTQQELTSYATKQQNLNQQLQDLTQNFMQQSQQLGQQILEAMQDNNTNSNSLKKFKGQSPPKSDTSASQAYASAKEAWALCNTPLTGNNGNACDFSKSAACSTLNGVIKSGVKGGTSSKGAQ